MTCISILPLFTHLLRKKTPNLIGPAIEYLEKAVKYGLNPKNLLSSPTFSALQEEVTI